MFSPINYGEFSKPNHVAIFLGNIVRNHYADDIFIKRIIITTIAHELSHSNQELSMMTYTSCFHYQISIYCIKYSIDIIIPYIEILVASCMGLYIINSFWCIPHIYSKSIFYLLSMISNPYLRMCFIAILNIIV